MSTDMLQARQAYSLQPPAPRTREQDQPTLLFSWWCTSFAAAIIIVRILGRKVRSNQLFREDWIMLFALIPLFIRMIFIHFVLIYQTNNVETAGVYFTSTELYERSIGSRLVLPARIFYAAFIWCCKLTVSEFLKRITIRIWRRSYELTLRGIRIFLVLTFIAVIAAALSECHPFSHYWQVVPDPGPRCRMGYAHLFTMGLCDVVTDLLLILFPIPIVLMSGQTWRRKLKLASLFGLSGIMIIITLTRVSMVVQHAGAQQYRTVWASCEILASAATSCAVILGSFVKDKGTKRNKYVSYSTTDSIDRVPTYRPTLHTFGSDEDLFRSVGYRSPEHLQEAAALTARPAPPALPPTAVLPSRRVSSPASHHVNASKYKRQASEPAVRRAIPSRLLSSPSVMSNRSASVADSSSGTEADYKQRPKHTSARSHQSDTPTLSDSSVITQDFAPLINTPRRSERTDSQESAIPQRHLSTGLHPFRFLAREGSSQSGRFLTLAGLQAPKPEQHEPRLQDAGGLLLPSSESLPLQHRMPSPQPARVGEPKLPSPYKAGNGTPQAQTSYFGNITGDLQPSDGFGDATVAALEQVISRSHE